MVLVDLTLTEWGHNMAGAPQGNQGIAAGAPSPYQNQMPMQGGGQPNIFQQASGAMTGAMGATGREMNYRPMAVGNYGYGAAQAGSQGYNPALGQSTGYNAAQAGSQGYTATQAGSQGYNAAQAESQGYNATQAESQGYNAAQAGAQGYNAATLSGSPTVTAQNVQAGQLAGMNLGAYINPYESQVVGQTLSDIERSRQMQANEAARQAQAAGAFGGSRSAILESETNRAFADQAARSAAQLRQAGFINAQQMAQQDIQRRMQADLANQGANLQAGTTTANLAQQAALSNQAATNQARQFGASAQNVASLQNMAAQNAARQFGAQAGNVASLQNAQLESQASQFGAQAANTAALQNMAAQNQASQFGAQASNVAALQNAQLSSQASQFGAQAANTAALQNMAAENAARQFGANAANQMTGQNLAALNQAGQFGASAANTAALQNMAARNQAGQFNASQALQAALANQQAGLQGSQQRLSAAGQMGTLGNLGFGMGQQVQQNMAQQGALQQALQQQIIDAARQQYQGYTGAPQQSLSYLAQALGMAPTPQTQTTKNQLGLMDYLGAGLGIYALSDMALKDNIQKIGQTKGGNNWYSWTWNDKAEKLGLSGESSGVIAQEIQKVRPEAVKEVDGYLAVNYSMVA